MKNNSRRNFFKKAGFTIGATTLGLSAFSGNKEQVQNEGKKLKLIVLGAHPDDPETNCGGVMSLFSNNGHEVISAYLTRGEAGIPGNSSAMRR